MSGSERRPDQPSSHGVGPSAISNLGDQLEKDVTNRRERIARILERWAKAGRNNVGMRPEGRSLHGVPIDF